jgi:hypothetical protein
LARKKDEPRGKVKGKGGAVTKVAPAPARKGKVPIVKASGSTAEVVA